MTVDRPVVDVFVRDKLRRRVCVSRRAGGGMHLLNHVLWIGGPPGTGKTTITTRLARRHGLRWYGADTRTWEHRDRALREGNAAAARWEAMTPEERWVTATPAEMLETSLHRERGPMVVDDLRRLPRSPLIVAEGSTVPPDVVASGIADRSRAVWLIPTPEFQRRQLEHRDLPRGPHDLYLLLAAEIERAASEHGAPVLIVDSSRNVDEMVAAVEGAFTGALAEGPRVETLAERRALLREANEAIAAQVRGYYARPWAEGDTESVVRTFLCECGDPSCEGSIEVPVAVSAQPVLAPGHG
jgi:hypothetical protein